MDASGLVASPATPGELLQLLRDGRPRTRAELGEELGRSRSTIGPLLDALLADGVVSTAGTAESTGGRPAEIFAIRPGSALVAAVDLGARHATLAICDLAGAILERHEERRSIERGPGATADWIAATTARLLARPGVPAAPLLAAGVGVPGPVEHATGRPIDPPIMPGWEGVELPRLLSAALGVPVLVDNDVNLMALGERSLVPELDEFLYVKVATGIGAGHVSDGRLHRGARGSAGDIGHIRVARAEGVTCRCGNEGCLEAIAAAPALAARLRAEGRDAGEDDIVRLVREGDALAARIVREAGQDLGEVLAACVNFANPAAVVIGGRLALAGETLLAGVREVVYRRATPLATAGLTIGTSRAGADAGILGAAALAVDAALSAPAVDARLSAAA